MNDSEAMATVGTLLGCWSSHKVKLVVQEIPREPGEQRTDNDEEARGLFHHSFDLTEIDYVTNNYCEILNWCSTVVLT